MSQGLKRLSTPLLIPLGCPDLFIGFSVLQSKRDVAVFSSHIEERAAKNVLSPPILMNKLSKRPGRTRERRESNI